MHMHWRVQQVRVEASVVLGLEEGRWKVERTCELRPVVTEGAARRLGASPGRMLRTGASEDRWMVAFGYDE
jgi:hypothetical protein